MDEEVAAQLESLARISKVEPREDNLQLVKNAKKKKKQMLLLLLLPLHKLLLTSKVLFAKKDINLHNFKPLLRAGGGGVMCARWIIFRLEHLCMDAEYATMTCAGNVDCCSGLPMLLPLPLHKLLLTSKVLFAKKDINLHNFKPLLRAGGGGVMCARWIIFRLEHLCMDAEYATMTCAGNVDCCSGLPMLLPLHKLLLLLLLMVCFRMIITIITMEHPGPAGAAAAGAAAAGAAGAAAGDAGWNGGGLFSGRSRRKQKTRRKKTHVERKTRRKKTHVERKTRRKKTHVERKTRRKKTHVERKTRRKKNT